MAYENLNKKQKEHKKKQDRARSRQIRNYVRKTIREYLRFRGDNIQLLFVMGDTENMETILLQRINLGYDRTLLTLPAVNDWVKSEYLDREYPEIDEEGTYLLDNDYIAKAVQDYYSIRSDEVIFSKKANLMIFRNCEVLKDNDLIFVNVRPYSLNTWYGSEALTIGQNRIYGGKKLKTFFRLENIDGYSKTYVFQDTILEILYYKGLMDKIDKGNLIGDIKYLAKKTYLSSFDAILYGLNHTDVEEVMEIFWHEDEENKVLKDKFKKTSQKRH